MHVCTNCGFEYEGKFCPQCGVKKNNGRIYFKDQLHDALYYVFSLDSPITNTFKGLFTNPGKVGREYISGKRKKYYTPIKYFILLTAIYFLTIKLTGIDPVSYKAEGIQKNMSYFIFLLAPLFALNLKLFFFKRGYNYSEYLAYMFYIVGNAFLLLTLNIPLSLIFPNNLLLDFIPFLYVYWALVSFHTGKLISRLILSLLTLIFTYVLFTLFLFTVAKLFY